MIPPVSFVSVNKMISIFIFPIALKALSKFPALPFLMLKVTILIVATSPSALLVSTSLFLEIVIAACQ
jgi:hypothetical protein